MSPAHKQNIDTFLWRYSGKLKANQESTICTGNNKTLEVSIFYGVNLIKTTYIKRRW